MERSSVVRPWMLRHLLRSTLFGQPFPTLRETLISAANKISNPSQYPVRALFNFTIAPITTATFHLPNHYNISRNFSSSSSGPSNMVPIESEEEFNSSLKKVEDGGLPAIYYFTASWCGPCRMLSPVLGQLMETYPHVTTYKVDIDKEGLGSTLNKLKIYSVPTLRFYQKGEKASEVVGADVQRVKDTMKELYTKPKP